MNYKNIDLKKKNANELVQLAFHYAVSNVDQEDLISTLEDHCWDRINRHPNLPKDITDARLQGLAARELEVKLEQMLTAQGDSAVVKEWMKTQTNDKPLLKKHFQQILETWRQERKKQQQAGEILLGLVELPEIKSEFNKIKLVNGYHPNNLNNLKPSQHWDIFIDETGSEFSHTAQELSVDDAKLGRLVALALPEQVKLKPLHNFHARKLDSTEVDRVVQYLLDAKVGVFGFTVKDPFLLGHGWINYVYQLMRWVMHLLPMHQDYNTSVNFFIEQRSQYSTETNIHILRDILHNEIHSTDAQRFAQFTINRMEFINKQQSKVSGYVDALAFTWGSPSAASKMRLQKSALLGHCLLQPHDNRILERLYLAVNKQLVLTSRDWYQLCTLIVDDGKNGLVYDFLARWGERVQANTALWHSYLEEVNHHLQVKDYRLQELRTALDWLEHWAPQGEQLSRSLQLKLEMARLADENHRGHVNRERVANCLRLSRQLRDEMATEVCETDLRIAVMVTNHFKFSMARPLIEDWLQQPVAVPGLLNVGKLYSTLGQIDAFTHQFEAAMLHFEQALDIFERLSDPLQAKREITQTRVYYLIARMDKPSVCLDLLRKHLQQHFLHTVQHDDLMVVAKKIASSYEPSARFNHHLFLRTLIAHPDVFVDERKAYLAQKGQWEIQTDYPWTHIEAYRAWLLVLEKQHELATQHMNAAIQLSSAKHNGPTLQWIAEVLRTLASVLALKVTQKPSESVRHDLRACLAEAPHQALLEFSQLSTTSSHEILWSAMQQCLPFNFR